MPKSELKYVPRLYFTAEAFLTIQNFVRLINIEISGLGRVRPRGRDFEVFEVFILPQTSSGVHTVLDPQALSAMMEEILARGDDLADIKLWWHSHVDMGCFWSGTDSANMRRLTVDSNVDFMFGFVGTRNGQMKVRLDTSSPVEMTIDDIEVVSKVSDIEKFVLSEIASKVNNPSSKSNKKGKNRDLPRPVVGDKPNFSQLPNSDDDFRASNDESLSFPAPDTEKAGK